MLCSTLQDAKKSEPHGVFRGGVSIKKVKTLIMTGTAHLPTDHLTLNSAPLVSDAPAAPQPSRDNLVVLSPSNLKQSSYDIASSNAYIHNAA